MLKVKDDIRGFTLAELMMSIGIILVLVLIAAPSIISIQKNMHMVELDNAAKQVAAAVQTQMTAEKVSGTWTEKIKPLVTDGNKARGLASDVQDTANIYYLTADQVRNNGLLPSLAIDSVVRDNDYVVEFNKTTATVCGVFYSDNKTGWFSPDTKGTAALAYYKSAALPAGRDQSARKAVNPLVGYFGGRSEGATPEVALEKPNLWIDGEGQLCVQDPNLPTAVGDKPTTATQVAVTNQDGSVAFMIAALQKPATSTDPTTYTIGVPGFDSFQYLNKGDTQIFKFIEPNVYQIDLNGLKKAIPAALKSDSSQRAEKLKAALAAFDVGTPMKVDAQVTTVNTVCVPATAQAFLTWPKPIPQLRVLVTNTSEKDSLDDTHKSPLRVSPSVEVLGGAASVAGAQKTSEEIKIGSIINDPEAAIQRYAGQKIALAKAVETEAVVRAETGKYQRDQSEGTPYRYQIYEIYINDTLIGSYDSQGVWAWNYSWAPSCFMFVNPTDSAPIAPENLKLSESLCCLNVNTKLLAEKLAFGSDAPVIAPNKADGYDIYLRAAPAMRDVQAYYAKEVSAAGPGTGQMMAAALSENKAADANARGADAASQKLQAEFRKQFGCSSSVALWTVAKGNLAKVVGPGGFTSEDLSLYYAPTPLRPSAEISKGDSNTLSCSAMFRLPQQSDFVMVPDAAIAQKPYEGSPLGDTRVRLASGTTDYLLPVKDATASYCRVLVYKDSKEPDPWGTKQDGITRQAWIPFCPLDFRTGASSDWRDDKYFYFPQHENASSFMGWRQTDPNTGVEFKKADNEGLITPATPLSVGSTPIVLEAQYDDPFKIGLMYLEFDAAGNVSGYYGSFDGKSPISNLSPHNEIASWGYYALVPGEAINVPWCDGISLVDQKRKVTIDNRSCRLFLIEPSPSVYGKKLVRTFSSNETFDPIYVSYIFNLSFAAAVFPGRNAYDVSWGTVDSPWQVRHADQMIMNLKTPEARSTYYKKAFQQTHDINWSERSAPTASLPSGFWGTYDGGGYAISGYVPGSVNDSSGNRGFGLFPQTKKATLTGVLLKDVVAQKTLTDAANCGVLADYAEDSQFYRCHVQSTAVLGSPTFISVQQSLKNTPTVTVGGLIGYAKGGFVEGCSASNMGLNFTSRGYDNKTISCGGLVGYAFGCSINPAAATVVNNVRFYFIEYRPPYNYLFQFGGLVGVLRGPSAVQVGTAEGTPLVSDVSFQCLGVPQWNPPHCGGLVGYKYSNAVFNPDKPGNGCFANVFFGDGYGQGVYLDSVVGPGK
ncbi:MAG: prepilin-type N-terminal cleavage/methylation domain-containing protein [Raoultibacter sp.]